MERLEKSKADLQTDMEQQLSSLREVISQKETTISSACYYYYCHYYYLVITITISVAAVVVINAKVKMTLLHKVLKLSGSQHYWFRGNVGTYVILALSNSLVL